MYPLTFNYSATVYVLLIYRCIFFIWIHYFEFLHIFVLPDVASSVVPGVGLSFIMFLIWDVPCSLTATLHMVLSCTKKFDFVFSYDVRCIFMTCMDISIYIYVSMWIWYFYKCLQDIFLICYVSHTWYFYTHALYIKFLNSFSLPDVLSSVISVSSVVSC